MITRRRQSADKGLHCQGDIVFRLQVAVARVGSQSAAAKAIDVKRQTLEHWLKGGAEPKPSALVRLAEVSGVDLVWLVSGCGAADGPAPLPALDERLLVEVVEVVEAFLRERRAALPPASKARAIVAGYADAVDRKGVDREALYRLLRIAFAL